MHTWILPAHWFSWRTVLGTLGITAVLWYLVNKLRQFIRHHSERIITATFRALNKVVTRSISARLSMKRYCLIQLSDESSRYLNVPGSKPTSLDVDSVFVPLTMEIGDQRRAFSSHNFLEAGARLLVVGDPGCGKSTLIKHAFREVCRETQSSPRKGRLPIRAELKRLDPPSAFASDQEAGQWLFNVLEASVGGVEGFEMSELFQSWVTDAGLLVMLDGLDEVAGEQYPLIVRALRGLSDKLARLSPKNTIVVTMRVQFHQQIHRDLVEEYPQTLYVRPFLPNEIYTFLSRWPFKSPDIDKNVNRIYKVLTDRPTLREMCSNPLILAMYVQHDYETGLDEIPGTRTQFYEKVINELLFLRRRRQGLGSRFTSLREQREALLGELAFNNLIDPEQSSNSLSWTDAIALAQRTWKCDAAEATLGLQELASETGIIAEERPGETFRFIHLTFCEFFAAVECARGRKNGWSNLLKKHKEFISSPEPQRQSRLVEVLPFAHALLPRLDRAAALVDVASLGDRSVLGRCFLETQLYEQPEWSEYVLQERDYLTSQGQQGWDEALLRRLHLFIVVVRDAQDWFEQVTRRATHEELDDVFATIVQGSRSAVLQIFSTYASQDAAAAIRLAEEVGLDIVSEHPELVIQSCQEESFLALILEKLSSDGLEPWADILAIAAIRFRNVAWRLDSTGAPVNNAFSKKQEKLLKLGYVELNSLYASVVVHILNRDDTSWTCNILRQSSKNAIRLYWMHRTRNLSAFAPLAIVGLMILLNAGVIYVVFVGGITATLMSAYGPTVRRITWYAYRFVFNISSPYIDKQIEIIDRSISRKFCRLVAPGEIELLNQVKNVRNRDSSPAISDSVMHAY